MIRNGLYIRTGFGENVTNCFGEPRVVVENQQNHGRGQLPVPLSSSRILDPGHSMPHDILESYFFPTCIEVVE